MIKTTNRTHVYMSIVSQNCLFHSNCDINIRVRIFRNYIHHDSERRFLVLKFIGVCPLMSRRQSHAVCYTYNTHYTRGIGKVEIQEAKSMLLSIQTPSHIIQDRPLLFVSLQMESYYDACSNFKIPSYIPNMIMALGTVLRRCGVNPPYMATMPSSFQTILKHWKRPVYLSCPFSRGA
jgi:hypothetical protein